MSIKNLTNPIKRLNGKHFCHLCLSQRPRKVGAKFSGTGLAPDEQDQIQLSMDYDGKRDRWNGYDPDEHMRIVEEYSKVDLVSHVVGSFLCIYVYSIILIGH